MVEVGKQQGSALAATPDHVVRKPPIRKIFLAFLTLLVFVTGISFFMGFSGILNKDGDGTNQAEDKTNSVIKSAGISILFSADPPFGDNKKYYVSDISGKTFREIPLVGDEIGPDFALSHSTKEIAIWKTQRDVLTVASVTNPSARRILRELPDSNTIFDVMWSHDDTQLVFEEAQYLRDEQRHAKMISVINADGSNYRSFDTLRNEQLIIFMGFNSQTNELFVRHAPTFIPGVKETYSIIDTKNGNVKKVLQNFKPMPLNYPYRITKDAKTAYYLKADGDTKNVRLIAFAIAEDKEQEVYRFDNKITSKDALVGNFLLSPTEKEIFFTIYNRTQKTTAHYKLDISTKKLRLVYSNTDYVFTPKVWSPDGRYIFADRAD